VPATDPTGSGRRERAQVLLVCSAGGHLLQLHSLRDAWEDLSRVWVSFDKTDVRSLLDGERVVFAFGPTNRNLPNLLRNIGLAIRVVLRVRPKVLVTTGAGVAVPFAWIARLCRAKVVYIESLTRIEDVSLSCRLIRPVASRVYVQWPETTKVLHGSRFVGNVFSDDLLSTTS
jgi:beta-1,4-N-acetylglucosaminyltransferase